jgi:hypothetical protein
MERKRAIKLFLFGLLFTAIAPHVGQAAATGGPAGDSVQNDTKAAVGASSAQKTDVCALLTSAEIEAVQDEPTKETKPSEQHGGNFVMSQCFFRTAALVKSVSLALATPDPARPSAPGPREYWQKQFHALGQAEKEKDESAAGKAKAPKESEEEREKELQKPRAVAGVGEEAFWTGNQITGALYVLKGNAFLRISIGGSEDESKRIVKTKTLAQRALKRLDGSH